MKLDAAINQLERGTVENRSTANKLLREALGIGIEAMKEIKRNRPIFTHQNIHLLPGETKD